MPGRKQCQVCIDRVRARAQTPKYTARRKRLQQTPGHKAKVRALMQTSEWKASNRALRHRRRNLVKANGGSSWTPEQFEALCAHFNHRCPCCGQPASQGNPLSADHVIPVSWVETVMLPLHFINDIDNIQPLLKNCNSSKHTDAVDYRTRPHAAARADAKPWVR